MNIIELDDNYKNVITQDKYVCCFGSFDGFHLGHMELVKDCLEYKNLKKACFFFDIPFSNIRDNQFSVLMSKQDKIDFLKNLNFDVIFLMKLSTKTMLIKREDFVQRYIINNNIKQVVVGEDFTFGYKKEGDARYLKTFTQFKTDIIPLLEQDNDKISSSTIKTNISQGNIEVANKQLGRNYVIKGEVVTGLHNGSKLGFKTANLNPETNYLIPKIGVYATYITINKKRYLSMTNIGFHPTLDKLNKIAIETNIFNYNKEIYKQKVSLEFLEYIRDERKFESVENLKQELENNKLYIQKKYK